jgi:hypothetical protein
MICQELLPFAVVPSNTINEFGPSSFYNHMLVNNYPALGPEDSIPETQKLNTGPNSESFPFSSQ